MSVGFEAVGALLGAGVGLGVVLIGWYLWPLAAGWVRTHPVNGAGSGRPTVRLAAALHAAGHRPDLPATVDGWGSR